MSYVNQHPEDIDNNVWIINKIKDNKKNGGGNIKLPGYSDAETQILLYLYNNAEADAEHGVEYIVSHGVHIKVGTGWQSGFGSRSAWFEESSNTLTLNYADLDNFTSQGNRTLSNLSPWGYSLVIHEALHLEQDPALAHSWEGERLAWQAGLRVYRRLSPTSAIEFAPGTDCQNVLDATNAIDFFNAIWDPFYKYTMMVFYPIYPLCSDEYCPPLPSR